MLLALGYLRAHPRPPNWASNSPQPGKMPKPKISRGDYPQPPKRNPTTPNPQKEKMPLTPRGNTLPHPTPPNPQGRPIPPSRGLGRFGGEAALHSDGLRPRERRLDRGRHLRGPRGGRGLQRPGEAIRVNRRLGPVGVRFGRWVLGLAGGF